MNAPGSAARKPFVARWRADAVDDGHGVPIRRAFPLQSAEALDPFVSLEEYGPGRVRIGGTGEAHGPAAEIEVLTYVLSGRVDYRDSSGGRASIAEGGLQWLPAANRSHPEQRARRERFDWSDVVHGLQLSVDVPTVDVAPEPPYRDFDRHEVPTWSDLQGAYQVRVLAGDYSSVAAPIRTRAETLVAYVIAAHGSVVDLRVPEAWTACLYVVRGAVSADGLGAPAAAGEVVLFERTGDRLLVECEGDETGFLLMAGMALGGAAKRRAASDR